MSIARNPQNRVANIALLYRCKQIIRRVAPLHRGGHGVHSPFVYKLIRRVIEQPYQYYGYNDIKIQRRIIKQQVKRQKPRQQSYKTAKLLFALLSRYKPQQVLEIGTTYSLSNQVIKLANPQSQITTIEPNRAVLDVANNISPITNTLYTQSYSSTLNTLLNKNYTPQFIYIKEHQTDVEYIDIVEAIYPHIPTKTIIMIEGIRKSPTKHQAYQKLITNPNIKITLDLYSTALLIANKKLNKKQYKTAL